MYTMQKTSGIKVAITIVIRNLLIFGFLGVPSELNY